MRHAALRATLSAGLAGDPIANRPDHRGDLADRRH